LTTKTTVRVRSSKPAARSGRPAARSGADASVAPSPLGSQIRDLREARRVNLAALAQAIGKSIGYVSQIERGRSEISISTLKAISEALGVQISWFFQGYDPSVPAEHGHVVRREHRRRLDFPGTGIEEELLSPTLTGEAELILSTFAPGARSGDEQVSRMAEQSGYVIEGELELYLGVRRFSLRAGDSFRIGRGESFSARNPGTSTSISLWVIAPPRY
jgi:transcriptional regulator with XRE-family HTH domain